MSRVVVKHRYKRDIGQVKAHIKYIGFRARELGEEKGFFNEKQDRGADYQKFVQKIEEHPALQHSATVKLHSLIISMRGADMDAFLEAGGDPKEMIRRIMEELELKKGMKLDWIAALHDKETHPHVHVAIMGVGEDAQGKAKRLYLQRDDYDFLRDSGRRYLEQYVPYEPERSQSRSQDQERGRGKGAASITSDLSHAGLATTASEKAQDYAKKQQQKKRSRDKSRQEQQKQADREHEGR